ncbi:MAG: 3-deoxy-7-phosphoheptulonate synthase [Mesoaciditoga sp.]|uniref:bifunctional 3-deoxy-7-phosphoheptulonate synthase/chorismate mutase n=1 Tax=Athalassotoga sp. TaxID=2022597 RepID=UPI000CABDFFF|nr:MAG: 3-deoxy-7-phosphoheptulonate synthase [Mesoaciditoga sp.]HEU24318.1 3-deoxy-7-phosphoheptulonate synthase [Mesoaciditoga lauensis]
MIIVLKAKTSEEDLKRVVDLAKSFGFETNISKGAEKTIVGIIGERVYERREVFEALNCVEEVIPVLKPFKLVSREFHPEKTIIECGDEKIGEKFQFIAGPCAVESRDQMQREAEFLSNLGVKFLRGGAFKPRTSPYSFQGLGIEGLKILREVGDKYNMKVVSEMMSPEDLPLFEEYVDVIQIGTRNMQNYRLLEKVGHSTKPVILKRGFMSTIEEWLLAAEYLYYHGNSQIILCERGIRTFEKYTRNTLDIAAVPLVKILSHLPIIVDLSHATGRRDLIPPLSKAVVAAGADGVMIEVHENPENALSDGQQSLNFDEFYKTYDSSMELIRVMEEI